LGFKSEQVVNREEKNPRKRYLKFAVTVVIFGVILRFAQLNKLVEGVIAKFDIIVQGTLQVPIAAGSWIASFFKSKS
jgi:hypothetical protein